MTTCTRFVTGSTAVVLGIPILVTWSMPGCDDAGESHIIVRQQQADPRFASADSLIEYYNELTTIEPVNLRRANELFYAETEQQQRYIANNGNYISVLEVHQALYDRFGQGYFPQMKSVFEPSDPATITERTPQRAIASYTTDRGDAATLQLVQVGDRWWISAYTLEDRIAQIPEAQFKETELVFRGIGAAGPEIIRRIDRGDFTTFEQARSALWLRAVQLEPELLVAFRGSGG